MSVISNLFGSKKYQSDRIEVLDVDTFSTAVAKDKVQLVDVRTVNEFKGGHIKNAINIDFFKAGGFQKAFGKLDKDKPVYVYCRSGARSKKASHKLFDMGFSKIYDLKGGYMQWK